MDTAGDAKETALARAVADELRRTPGVRAPLSMSDLVLRCAAAGVSAPEVLRQALDRVTSENEDQSSA